MSSAHPHQLIQKTVNFIEFHGLKNWWLMRRNYHKCFTGVFGVKYLVISK